MHGGLYDGGPGNDVLGPKNRDYTGGDFYPGDGDDLVRFGARKGAVNSLSYDNYQPVTANLPRGTVVGDDGVGQDRLVGHATSILTANGADTIRGYPVRRLYVFTGGGRDRVVTGRNNDSIESGDGVDVVRSRGGNDEIIEKSDEPSTILTGRGNDTLKGEVRGDVYLGKGRDEVTAYALRGLAYHAGPGRDTYTYVDAWPKPLVWSMRTGVVRSPRRLKLVGFENFTSLRGEGRQRVTGTSGPNRMLGNKGNDALFGRGGHDFLHGGLGRDTLDGGPGRDGCRMGETVRRCEK